MIDLLLSNNRIAVFLEQKKKKNQITANTLKAFQLLEAVISLEAGQMSSYILAERFCQHQIENYFGR